MIKKGTALCVATFVLAGCGKDHTQWQFNRTEQCSVEYLEFLKKDCSDQVKKWIETNKDLLLKLEIWKVDKIIIPDQNSKNTNDIETRCREITERPNAKFFGGESLRITLEEIDNNFNNHWEKNTSIFSSKLSEYAQLAAKVSLNVPENVINFLDTFKKQEKEFFNNIDCKIAEIRFEYVIEPERNSLIDKIKGIIENFKKFCELVNFEKDKDIDFEQLVVNFKNHTDFLKNKIDKVWIDNRNCFIEMISRKIDKCPQVLKAFLANMDLDIVEDEFAKLEEFEHLTSDDVFALVQDVNISKLAPKNISVLKKIQEALNFYVEWEDGQGLKLSSDLQEILLPKNQCHVKETATFNGIELIMKVEDKNYVLNNLIGYINKCKVFTNNIDTDSKFINDGNVDFVLNEMDKVKFDNFSIDTVNLRNFIENCYNSVLSKRKK